LALATRKRGNIPGRDTDGARGRDRVELVRVEEHRRLGCASVAEIMVDGDAVEQLGSLARGQAFRVLFDQPQPEVDVAQQAAFVGGCERRPARKLERPSNVVDERSGEEQLGAQARMKLRRLTAERRHADRVLQQSAGIGVVILGRRRIDREVGVCERSRHGGGEPRMRNLGDQELQKALQLLGITPHRRRQARGIDIGRLERAHIELEPVAEALDSPQHTHCIALTEAPIEQLDVVPNPCLNLAGLIDELEREVRCAGLRAHLSLRFDGEDAFDGAVFR